MSDTMKDIITFHEIYMTSIVLVSMLLVSHMIIQNGCHSFQPRSHYDLFTCNLADNVICPNPVETKLNMEKVQEDKSLFEVCLLGGAAYMCVLCLYCKVLTNNQITQCNVEVINKPSREQPLHHQVGPVAHTLTTSNRP